jgi:hypothetical protein
MNKYYNREILIHPYTLICSGASKSGKTCLISKIIKDRDELMTPKIENIFFCYSIWQPEYDELVKHGVTFIDNIFDVDQVDKTKTNLIIYDDMMDECASDKSLANVFTKGSHHNNISVILLCQNLFNKQKHWRTISLNTNYFIIFKNPRDMSQINYLARQLYPNDSKFLLEAYIDASKKPHGYLFIDMCQATENEIRVQTSITDNVRVVYTQK